MFIVVTAAQETATTINASRGSIILCRKIDLCAILKLLDVIDPMMRQGICVDLYLDSRGGDVRATLLLGRFLANHSRMFTAYNIGNVDSAAILLYVAAGHRVATPNASFYLHRLSVASSDRANFDDQDILTELTNDVCRFVQERVAVNKSIWQKMMCDSLLLSSSRARDIGLVDEIRDVSPPCATICI